MAGIVSDTFGIAQPSNTSAGPGIWTPSSLRVLSSPVGDINDISGGNWNISILVSSIGTCSLLYEYTVPQDFTSLSNIMLIGVVSSIPATLYSLLLQDSMNNTRTVSSISMGNTVTWNISSFTGFVNLTQIIFLVVVVPASVIGTISVNALISTAVCLAKDSIILMSDGSKKAIQYIERGDLVAGNKEITVSHRVARNMTMHFHADYPIDIVMINKDALDENIPDKKTFISGWHPILWNGARRPAKCFENLKGIKWWYHTISAGEILPSDSQENTYSLYNLQFDHDGMFVANNMIVQAVSPYSELFPLDKKLFFDENNYKDQLTWESYITDTPWDCSVLESL